MIWKVICMLLVMALGLVLGYILGALKMGKRAGKIIQSNNVTISKNIEFYHLMAQWVKLKQNGKSIEEYLQKNHCQTIAIYGMDIVGKILVEELRETSIDIMYLIDQNNKIVVNGYKLLNPKDNLPPVDAVIVTPIYYYEDIKKMLSEKLDTNIISIKHMIDEILE